MSAMASLFTNIFICGVSPTGGAAAYPHDEGREGGFRHLAVVDGGRVLGAFSTRDIPALAQGRMAKEIDGRHR